MAQSAQEDVLARVRAAAEAVDGVHTAEPIVRHEVRAHRRASVLSAAVLSAEEDQPPEGAGFIAYGGDLPAEPGAAETLQQALRLAAEAPPDRGTVYLTARGESYQSYGALLRDAERLLGGLRRTGVAPGDSVLFQFADNRSFVTAFWACVLGGFLPTPVGPAPGYDRENAVTTKLRNAWELLDRPLVLTDESLAASVRNLATLWDADDLRVADVGELSGGEPATDWFPATPDTPVVHLLTSGSTGVPKCVRHTSRSILARTRATAAANGFDEHEVSLNWMPLDHVGGIVMYNVRDVVLRCRHVNATIGEFLAEPLRWLDWSDRYRVTNTWAPNFAFAQLNERLAATEGRSWDLSTLRHICNAGEAVVSRTAERFQRLLGPHRLPAGAMRPCWGMSETSSGVTYSVLPADDPHAGRLWVDKHSLSGALRLAEPGDPEAICFTEVGPPIPGVRLRIVDHEDRVLPADRVGRLQITGPTIMSGYHRNDAANAASFTEDGWFRTGDLAFLHQGSLTITGREKDMIVINGANHLSYDIESIVEQVPGTEVTWTAACGWAGPGNQADRLVVFFVPTDASEVDDTIAAIRARLAEQLGLRPHLVVPVERAAFPKTGSGKIQRAQLVADLEQGRFDDWLTTGQNEEIDDDGLPAWFFERVWTESTDRPDRPLPPGPWLVIGGEVPAQRLAVDVIVAGPDEDLRTVLRDRRPGLVLDARGLADQPADGPLQVADLIRELAAEPDRPELLVLTRGGLWARPGDRLDPAWLALPGLIRTAAAEQALPLVRQLDLPAGEPADWADMVLDELRRPAGEDLVARRAGQRLVPRLAPVPPAAAGAESAGLVPGGRYLITGGLGGIAFALAEYLLAAYQARLLLVGRSAVAGAAGERAARLEELHGLGAAGERAARLEELRGLGDVEYRALDVADENGLRRALTEAERRWGAPLDGVLHLAGADVSAQWTRLERHTVARESRAGYLAAYRAKVDGTLSLAALLRDRPETLLVLFSSVNGDFGGSSFAAYASANSFLTGFADHWGRELGRPVRCLAWSTWTGVGMNRAAPAGAAAARGFRPIDVERGLASFVAALRRPRPHLLIGLDGRNEHIVRDLAPGAARPAELIVAYAGTAPEAQVRRAVAGHARQLGVPVHCLRFAELPAAPDGGTDRARVLAEAALSAERGGRRYVAPAGDLERRLAALWGEVLGRDDVGRDDRFFDLGGSSVRAAQLVGRINGVLPGELSLHHLYEHPTVGELATVLQRQ
ncbi:SDR family NAD(P)-dependent oxidoreductase [Actinoplanes sp. KI2]|uniref:non-ribosomal peptide synthetase n=1 Tax=Actinoplanes sp. KI2 TaxID=2983315 RepID=UPI0021D590EB|nr:non-ribosomal peptide synthetase [Actinoplanes sp. KI2]MCU7728824.1 SDR family NAD(P)-dependent oxidoreductase [Actinoplanes sp. KI2]